ncbi:MAG: hypothetical protein J6T64_00760 [Bacteroidaceae bacterium]|nr:hypothetical protein [Bacteroidaceae bacterium]
MEKISFPFETILYDDKFYWFQQTRSQCWKEVLHFFASDLSFKCLFALPFVACSLCCMHFVDSLFVLLVFFSLILCIILIFRKNHGDMQINKEKIQKIEIDNSLGRMVIVYSLEEKRLGRKISFIESPMPFVEKAFDCPIIILPQKKKTWFDLFIPLIYLFGVIFIDGMKINILGFSLLRDLCSLIAIAVLSDIIYYQIKRKLMMK